MTDHDSIRILHVEDDAGLARLFQRRLQRAGFVVDLAEDGEKGLEMLAAHPYDLLVLDQRMPRMSGLDVIKNLSAEGAFIPTIMLTGAGSESVAVEAMKLGASDYIIKDSEGRYLELMPAVAERAVRNHRLVEEKRKADEELRRNKETIEALLNATTDMAALVESSGAILELNQPFAHTCNKPSSELIGASIFDVWPPDTAHERRSCFDEVLRTGKPSRHEDFHDGRFYDNTLYPVFGDDGIVVAVAAFTRDVTEQRLAQAELQKAHDELERRVVERTAALDAANKELRGEIAVRTSAERQVKEQNEFLRNVLESLSHPFYVVDVNDFRLVEANSATGVRTSAEMPTCYAAIYGRSEPCDPAEQPCPTVEAKNTKAPATVEHVEVGPDGMERLIQVHAYPIFDATGEVVRVIEYRLDITERKRAEQAITRTNTLLAALSRAQTQFISDADADDLFEGLLAALLSMTDSMYGFIGEVLTGSDGKPYLKIRAVTNIAWDDRTTAFYANYAAEGLEFHQLDNLYGEVIRTGKPVICTSRASDPRARPLPESHPPINSFLGLPFHVGEELIGMVGIANRPGGYDEETVAFLQPYLATSANLLDAHRNRLRREWAEEQLRSSEERFRTVFESARDCIFIKDRAGAYALVNPEMERLLNMPASALVGKTDREIYGKEAGDHLQEVDARVLAGEPVEAQHTREVKGVPLTFLDTRVPMRNAQNEIIGIIGIARNITDLKSSASFSAPLETEYRSHAMRRTLAEGRTVALSDGIVLLTGESGSGKDYLARFIHSRSKRSAGPFFAVNCAAVPAELAESELFGHEAGAFTGAGRRKRGLLELAEGGTLLLNEIGELSLNLQAKLLTFLDTRAFTRVGGISPVSVSARLIAATNRDLQTEVAQRRFRSDLFFRLNVFSITVPPLRERLEDLPLLVQELIAHLTADMRLPHEPEVDSGVLAALGSYPWPGNVRELRNVLERSLMLSGGRRITVPALGLGRAESDWSCTVTFPEGRTLRDITGEITRSLVAEALRRCHGSKRAAARLLGISHDSLYRFMRMYEIAVGESDTVAYESSDSKTDRNMITS